tara:strand:+ start:696 stop:854 length:159 start_codon:yes stop_codon:yes gene_type:complete
MWALRCQILCNEKLRVRKEYFTCEIGEHAEINNQIPAVAGMTIKALSGKISG